jgi:hypothetical protein
MAGFPLLWYLEIIKVRARKDTQKSSIAGGLANVCVNHQLHVRDDTCSENLISLARATGLKIIRLASSKLTLNGKAYELGAVVVTLIAACLHCGINGVHCNGFH